MNRICLFGFSRYDEVFLDFKDEIFADAEIKIIVTDMEIKQIENQKTSIKIINYNEVDYTYIANNCDIVIICDSYGCSEDFLIEGILKLSDTGVTIYNLHDFKDIKEIDFSSSENIRDFSSYNNISIEKNFNKIELPVVYCLGVGDQIEQFSSSISLYLELKKLKYKVAIIFADKNGNISSNKDWFNIPERFWSNNTIGIEKFGIVSDMIENYNLNLNYDIIIIDYSREFSGEKKEFFIGESLRVLDEMFRADYIILNTYHNTLDYNSQDHIMKLPYSIFQKDADCILVTNKIQDVAPYENGLSNDKLIVSKELCRKNCSFYDCLIAYQHCFGVFERISNDIIEKLTISDKSYLIVE